MSTIELTNNNLLYKFEILKDMCRNLSFITEAEELEENYILGSIDIIIELFYGAENKKIYEKYNSFIQSENFINKMERLYKKCIPYSSEINEFSKLCNKFFSNNVLQNIKKFNYDICPECGNKMCNTGYNEIYCEFCGVSQSLCSSYIEEESGQIEIKHGTYDPIKQLKFWIERIQANELFDPEPKVINQLEKCIKQDNIICKQEITYKRLRKYLQQTKNSNLNEHIPSLRKYFTGITPPQLAEAEVHLLTNYFIKIIRIYMEIKSPNKTNCPYIPYFIYKILEQILPENIKRERCRKYGILSCIHLQSRDTLIENDKTWKKICTRIPNFKYIPTDRNKNLDIYACELT